MILFNTSSGVYSSPKELKYFVYHLNFVYLHLLFQINYLLKKHHKVKLVIETLKIIIDLLKELSGTKDIYPFDTCYYTIFFLISRHRFYH